MLTVTQLLKDNPAFVIERVRAWQGLDAETDALLKHACSSLLKQGDPETLALFSYDAAGIESNRSRPGDTMLANTGSR